MADSNRGSLAFVEETTWSTTPASALQALRFTNESIVDQEGTTESAEVLADRQLSDVIRTSRYCDGSIDGELSYGTLDTLLEGVLCDTWASGVLENGTEKKSYTFEKQFVVDASPSTHFLTYKGCRLDTLNLTLSPESTISYSLGIVGLGGVNATTTAGSGAYTAAGTTEALASDKVTSIEEASSTLSKVTEISLDFANNLRRQMGLGSTDPIGYGYGGFRTTGMVRLYFQDMALYDKYEAETKSELEFTVTDAAGNAYTFTIPQARWGAPEITNEGVNGDVFAQHPFTAVKDAGSTESTVSITRTAA